MKNANGFFVVVVVGTLWIIGVFDHSGGWYNHHDRIQQQSSVVSAFQSAVPISPSYHLGLRRDNNPHLPLSFLAPHHVCLVTNMNSKAQQQWPLSTGEMWPLRRLQNSQNNNILRLHLSTTKADTVAGTIDDDNFVEAEDFEALQLLFAKYSDPDGLITKSNFLKIPAIADLLASGDLLMEEFNEIYDRAPKFPDEVGTATATTTIDTTTTTERIDVDSFVQVYRDIDDLFETDDDDSDVDKNAAMNSNNDTTRNGLNRNSTPSLSTATPQSTNPAATVTNPTLSDVESVIVPDDDNVAVEIDGPDPALEGELESIYDTLCDKSSGLLSREQLMQWDEISKLLADGLLGEDEFEELWDSTIKSGETPDNKIDLDGFLSFNSALDKLFDFDDEEMDDVVVPKSEYQEETTAVEDSDFPAVRMIEGSDLPPDVLFVSLANADGLVGYDELMRWSELRDMLENGDVLESELMEMLQKVPKSARDLNKVEEDGFIALYNAIDNLFEDDDSDAEVDSTTVGATAVTPTKAVDDASVGAMAVTPATRGVSQKEELLDAIADLRGDETILPCGLDATDLEQREIQSIVEQLEVSTSNLVRSRNGAISPKELSGEWELIYSSSSAMKFNKGLSGLGGSVPNGRFSNLKQKLLVTKQLTDVEYIERIEMKPSSASFDVRVTGTWDLRTSVSLFTGEPSLIMNVVPDRVTYGPTSTRADHWKSLGPMNMLDITYLDADLRIMRGNTSVDTIFVFRRT